MHHDFPFLSLLLITVLAAVLPLFSSRLRLPQVVVEILAGIIVGQSGLRLIESGPALDFLATFGFTYLMLLSGLELDYETSSLDEDEHASIRTLRNPLVSGLLIFLLTVAGALLVAMLLSKIGLINHPVLMALILSTTSLGIAMPVLKERGLMATHYGQALLVAAVVADFGTMLLITVVTAVISRGLTLDLLLVFVLLAVFALTVRIGHLARSIPGLQRLTDELAHATTQIYVRATFALMVAFIALSKWLGTEVILGAFLAGAVIALLTGREGSLLHLKIEAMGYGFFIPIFFIMVGVRFDLQALLNSSEALLLLPLLLVAAYAVKFLPALLYRLQFTWRETFAAGMLLSARLSLIIAVAAIALDLQAISHAVHAAIVLLALVTCTVSPVLFTLFLPPSPATGRQGMLLVGLGPLSTLLAERLRESQEVVTMVGRDSSRAVLLKRRGLQVVEGDPLDPEVLRQAGAETAAALLSLSSSDERNFAVCRLAREQFSIPNLITLANDPAVAMQMSDLGLRVVQTQLATALALEGAVHFPETFDMLVDPADGATVREAVLRNPQLTGQPLRQVRLPSNALIMGLRRRDEVIVPHGNTVLHLGDVLMLVGSPEELQKAILRIAHPTG